MGELPDEEEAGPPQYTAPKVRAPCCFGTEFAGHVRAQVECYRQSQEQGC